MNIQRKNSAHHFRMQGEREQTLVQCAEVNGDFGPNRTPRFYFYLYTVTQFLLSEVSIGGMIKINSSWCSD